MTPTIPDCPLDLALLTLGPGIVTPEVEAEVDRALAEIRAEVLQAMRLHAPMTSEHDGFAVLAEEMDELKAEVWKSPKKRDYTAMHSETVQVGAMAVRLLVNRIYRRLSLESES